MSKPKVVAITTDSIVMSTELDFTTFRTLDAIPSTLTGDVLLLTGTFDLNELTLTLIQLRNRFKNIIYISKDLDMYISFIVELLGGYTYKDTGEYLQPDVLEWIIGEVGTTGLEQKKAEETLDKVVVILTTILDNIEKGDVNAVVDMLMSTDVFKTIKITRKDLREYIANHSTINESLEGVLTTINRVLEENVKTERTLKRRIDELRFEYNSKIDSREKTGIDFYPVYHVPESPFKVMYVKKYSEVSYLNTLILSYADYLKNKQNKTVKVLFLIPKQANVIKKFSVFPSLSKNKLTLIDLNSSDVFVTSEPESKVWDKFFEHKGVHMFIVVDLTFAETLLKGSPVKAFSAVGSSKDLKTFNLSKETAFTFLFSLNTLAIDHIQQFKKMTKEQKLTSCYDKHKKLFEKLDSLLGVN